jgi:hypothetical protein
MFMARALLIQAVMRTRAVLAVIAATFILGGTASAALKNGDTTRRWGNQYVRGSKRVVADKGKVVRSTLFKVQLKDGAVVRETRIDDFAGGGHRSEWTTKHGQRVVFTSDRGAGTWRRVTYERGTRIGRVTSSADKPGDPERWELDPMGSVSEGVAVLAHIASTTNQRIVTSPYGVDLHIAPGESATTILRRLDTLPKR